MIFRLRKARKIYHMIFMKLFDTGNYLARGCALTAQNYTEEYMKHFPKKTAGGQTPLPVRRDGNEV